MKKPSPNERALKIAERAWLKTQKGSPSERRAWACWLRICETADEIEEVGVFASTVEQQQMVLNRLLQITRKLMIERDLRHNPHKP